MSAPDALRAEGGTCREWGRARRAAALLPFLTPAAAAEAVGTMCTALVV
eukprot:gene2081-18128_t